MVNYVTIEVYFALFNQLCQHDYDINVVLVDHSPKIIGCFFFWTLAGYVLVFSRVSLKCIIILSVNAICNLNNSSLQ